MKLLINKELTISTVQKEFNDMFPYLKLQFFSKLHRTGKASHPKFMVMANKKLGDITALHKEGSITVTPAMTVAGLEQLFGNEFGLGVQVFRKSGGIWLETIFTDTWTLAEQNRHGELLGTDIEPEKPENPSDRN